MLDSIHLYLHPAAEAELSIESQHCLAHPVPALRLDRKPACVTLTRPARAAMKAV